MFMHVRRRELCVRAYVCVCVCNQAYLSYLSMAWTHLHRPSAAVEAVLTFSGTNSGLEVYVSRIFLMMLGGMLSYVGQTEDNNTSIKKCVKFGQTALV